jgi:2-keto-4-pentenoate hydratase/2-oxohepta-3-ene-1,7-dioic acid hydratase in catechol pathway
MRFAHLRSSSRAPAHLAVVMGDSALFLDLVMPNPPRDLQELIEDGEYRLGSIRSLVEEALVRDVALVPLSEVSYASAALRPPQVIAIGANYMAHASELKLRSEKAATVFSLWPNSLSGHGATTSWAAELTSEVDYEVELGAIIGRPAYKVNIHEALDYVWGYTAVNDITARDLQFSEAQWSRCKSFDGFTPTGSVVVTADEIPDPQNLRLTTNVDGRLMQNASTSDMVRSVAEIIEFLSRSATLQPGTLISTGSPGGAGYSQKPPVFLRHGSRVTVSVVRSGHPTTHCIVG